MVPVTDRVPQGQRTLGDISNAGEPHPKKEDIEEATRGSDFPLSLQEGNAFLSPSLAVSRKAQAQANLKSASQKSRGILPRHRSLGGGRIDPFSTLGRKISPRENYLASFFVHDMISIFGGNAHASLFPQRDIYFPVIMEGSTSLEAMFAYASGFLSKKLGHPDTEAKKHHILAVRSLNNAISDPSQRFLNHTMLAILGLINLRN